MYLTWLGWQRKPVAAEERMDARSLVETVLSGKDRPFGVRLWDGTALPPVHPPGVPILVIAHDAELIRSADRRVCLAAGRVVAESVAEAA